MPTPSISLVGTVLHYGVKLLPVLNECEEFKKEKRRKGLSGSNISFLNPSKLIGMFKCISVTEGNGG